MSLFVCSANFRLCLPSVHTSRRLRSQEGKRRTDGLEEVLDDLDLEDDTTIKKPLVTTFELNETLYAEAELDDTDVVYLWLGVRSPYCSLFCSDNVTDHDFTAG